MTVCLTINLFKQIFIATFFEPEGLRNSLRIFSEACLKIPQSLATSVKFTFVAHFMLKLKGCLLFTTIKDLGMEITPWSDQTIVCLKEWCHEISYAVLSEKKTVFKKYLLLKKFFF